MLSIGKYGFTTYVAISLRWSVRYIPTCLNKDNKSLIVLLSSRLDPPLIGIMGNNFNQSHISGLFRVFSTYFKTFLSKWKKSIETLKQIICKKKV